MPSSASRSSSSGVSSQASSAAISAADGLLRPYDHRQDFPASTGPSMFGGAPAFDALESACSWARCSSA